MQANEPARTRLFRQFLFSPLEILLLVLVNGGLLLYAFYVVIIRNSPTGDEFKAFADIIVVSTLIGWIRSIVATIITANVATMLLWGVIGSFTYSIITGVQLLFTDASSTFKVAFTYVHPKGYKKANFILQVIIERLVSVITIFIMVLYVWAFCIVIMPYVFNGIRTAVEDLSVHSFSSAVYFVFFSLALHMLFVLVRIESGRYNPDRL